MSSIGSKLTTGLAVAALCGTLIGCAEASTESFTIRVIGPPQTRFTGQCSAIESDQTTNGVDLEGILTSEQDAVEFEAVGEQIYCALYAQDLEGTLRLELLRNGELLDSAQTSEPFQDISIEYP